MKFDRNEGLARLLDVNTHRLAESDQIALGFLSSLFCRIFDFSSQFQDSGHDVISDRFCNCS